MKAIKLTHDDEIKNAFNDEKVNIYFREGNEGNYEVVDGYSLEDILDATCHGFEFVSIEGPSKGVVSEDNLEFEENEREI